ncbi:MAG: UTP--glucose-1-phosphate uridylyltransferase [Planctomycetota bacterium]
MDPAHTVDDQALRTALTGAGQGHLVEAWQRLEPSRRSAFRAQLAAIDLVRVREMAALLSTEPSAPAAEEFEAAKVFPVERTHEQERRALEARRAGQEALARGEVGWLLVAGGQASRLGIDVPKGMFPVGPVTGRTLFEWFARKLLAARGRFRAAIPWYVMTSEANDAATRSYFEENDHFGIDREDVFFFRQGMLPALDPEGRILLSAPDRLFWAPDGHGGALAALAASGALADARRRGITTLSYFQVDNPLARPADPLFLGLHRLDRAQMSSKVVAKRDASEKVGVIGRVSGRLACIEYSDLPGRLREARDPAGRLVFSAGNVAMHVLDLDFVESLTRGGLKLPWHLARKQVGALDESGRPAQRTGIKFESFVFDALGMAERSVTLEVRRSEEFSPVKNATGEDSPATTRADLCRLFGSWVGAAGLPLPPRASDGLPAVEVDPLFAEDLESFLSRGPREPRGSERGHLYA